MTFEAADAAIYIYLYLLLISLQKFTCRLKGLDSDFGAGIPLFGAAPTIFGAGVPEFWGRDSRFARRAGMGAIA